jgi:hypothetical protein
MKEMDINQQSDISQVIKINQDFLDKMLEIIRKYEIGETYSNQEPSMKTKFKERQFGADESIADRLSDFLVLHKPSRDLRIESDTLVDTLMVKIHTGEDDLREKSNAIAEVHYLEGNQITLKSMSLNDGTGWGLYTWHTIYVSLPNVALKDIKEFHIKFTSGKRYFTDQEDRWDLNDLTVNIMTSGSIGEEIIGLSGTPLHNFYSQTPDFPYFFNW